MRIGRPSEARIRAHLSHQAELAFTHSGVGLTRDVRGERIEGLPSGYVVDHNRVQLGEGMAVFERAKSAVREWQMFKLGWVELCWPTAPVEVGTTVGIMIHAGVLWSVSACRIVYVIDEPGEAARFGFGYGTLPDHAECGEERFMVEYNPGDDSVWYDLLAFSRPGALITRIGYRWSRALQRRFARNTLRAMSRSAEMRDRSNIFANNPG